MNNLISDRELIRVFCERWKIVEFAVFGSALRDDFRTDSDVDALVTFAEDAHWTLFDLGRMQEQLEGIFGREVDLVSRRGLEASGNYLRRKNIIESAQVIYASSMNTMTLTSTSSGTPFKTICLL